MHKRLISFLIDKCNVIKTNQYGFRENGSHEIDNKKYSFGLFLDLSKAFDTIDHHILLQQLAKLWYKR